MLKDLIEIALENPKYAENIRKTLKDEKISVWDTYEVFYKHEVSLGEWILSKNSICNLERIERGFSCIFGEKDFLSHLERYVVKDPQTEEREFVLKEDYPEWRKWMEELFSMRNKFVHQVTFGERIGKKKIEKIVEHLVAFTEAIFGYALARLYPEIS